MTEIRFYHLEKQSLESVLPSLLARALVQGHKIMIKGVSDEEMEKLSEHLWTYTPDSFLPHGTRKDGHAEIQPVLLTTSDENANAADMLILTGGALSENLSDFKLCCEMLNGHDESSITGARTRWKIYKDKGFEVTYWQQGDKGWEKKSS